MSDYCARCGCSRANHRQYPDGLRCPYQRRKPIGGYRLFETKETDRNAAQTQAD